MWNKITNCSDWNLTTWHIAISFPSCTMSAFQILVLEFGSNSINVWSTREEQCSFAFLFISLFLYSINHWRKKIESRSGFLSWRFKRMYCITVIPTKCTSLLAHPSLLSSSQWMDSKGKAHPFNLEIVCKLCLLSGVHVLLAHNIKCDPFSCPTTLDGSSSSSANRHNEYIGMGLFVCVAWWIWFNKRSDSQWNILIQSPMPILLPLCSPYILWNCVQMPALSKSFRFPYSTVFPSHPIP